MLNLNTLVHGLHEMFKSLVRDDILLIEKPAPDLGKIRADISQIEQILLNLVVNARDAITGVGIVAQFGGEIFVESELGEGTTFSVYFPLTKNGVTDEVNKQPSRMAPLRGTELAEAAERLRPEMRIILMSGYASSLISENYELNPNFAFLENPSLLPNCKRWY